MTTSIPTIADDFGQGGANLAPGGETGLPTLATVLQAIKAYTESNRRNGIVHLRAVAPSAAGVNPYVVATAQCITLPDDAKAGSLLVENLQQGKMWARAGTGTLGGLATQASPSDAEPGAGSIGITPSGDLVLNHVDNFTSVDAAYLRERYDLVPSTVYNVTPGTGVVLGLPPGLIFILEAEVTVGGVTGKCIVQAPAATAPTTGCARLDLGKNNIFCCAADAVTKVRLKLGVIPVDNQ